MILALFAILILTSLVSIVLASTIAQQVKTRKAADFTFAGQAADTAVNDALLMANLNEDIVLHPTLNVGTYVPGTPRGGVTGDFMWSWSAVPGPDPTPTWVVTATGCRNQNKDTVDPPACTSGSARTIRATLTGTVVDGPATSGGETAYVLTPADGFGRALLADQDLIMQGGSSVGSYNSATADVNTGFGHVGSNGLAAFDSSVTLDRIYFSNTQSQPSSERCAGVQCGSRAVNDIRPKLLISNTTFIADKVAACAAGQPDGLTAWVASEAAVPGHLDAGMGCYSSLTFDVNTIVDGAADTPTVLYVDGPITVAPGVKVNMPNPTPAASTLQVLSSGTVVSIGGGTSVAELTEVAWTLWAPKALCSSNPAVGFVTVYGSTVCQKIFTQGNFTALWDEALRTTAAEPAGAATVWDTTGYQDQSAVPAP